MVRVETYRAVSIRRVPRSGTRPGWRADLPVHRMGGSRLEKVVSIKNTGKNRLNISDGPSGIHSLTTCIILPCKLPAHQEAARPVGEPHRVR